MIPLISTSDAALFGLDHDPGLLALCTARENVVAVQQRHIRPVLGATFCGALELGLYADLLAEFVKPAMALYIKIMLVPRVSAQIGSAGVVTCFGQSFAPADANSVEHLMRSMRRQARSLLRAAIDRMNADPDEYPDWVASESSLGRASIEGGLVIT
jgi:hypothetical protein